MGGRETGVFLDGAGGFRFGPPCSPCAISPVLCKLGRQQVREQAERGSRAWNPTHQLLLAHLWHPRASLAFKCPALESACMPGTWAVLRGC